MGSKKEYTKMTAKMCLQLAAPHTWVASLSPVLIAVCLTIFNNHCLNPVMVVALAAISILMQSAVNTFNDFFDFVKGSDSESDSVEASDAVLVYNDIDPKQARNLAIGFLVAAFLIGIYVICIAGFVPLLVAIIGAVIVFLYSGGKTPISYLPIGEIVSGFTMGCLITFAAYVSLTRTIEWMVLVWSIPLFLGIALIMLTNNTCDIEKDEKANRRTLPTILGRKRSIALYHWTIRTWYASILVIIACHFIGGALMYVFLLLFSVPVAMALYRNPLDSSLRIQAMSQICSLNLTLAAFYAASILLAKLVVY